VHVNITGGGVTRASRNPEAAQRLLEFLSSDQAQGGYAAANHEYPLNGIGEDPVLQAWGPFQQAKVSAERLGQLNAQALELMAASGWQ
jgi:iron(III) transport system substrate-binding protein